MVLDGPQRTRCAAQVARGFVIFEQPVSRAFQLLAQTSRQKEYRPELDAIETVECARRRQRGRAPPARSCSSTSATVFAIASTPRGGASAGSSRPGFENDLERVDGSWELYALEDGRTLGVFGTVVEVGAGMPAFLQDYVTRKNLPRTLERCRRWVDGDGRPGD